MNSKMDDSSDIDFCIRDDLHEIHSDLGFNDLIWGSLNQDSASNNDIFRSSTMINSTETGPKCSENNTDNSPPE
jgi:hypothetical protein